MNPQSVTVHPVDRLRATVPLAAGVVEQSAQAPPGTGVLHFARSGSRTVVRRAFATSPLKLLNPRATDDIDVAWVYTATLGGGLLGGDAIHLNIDVATGARALLATQASTKIYRSTRPTSQHLSASIADGALLGIVPDPIVCFAGSSFQQEQRYELSRGASLVLVDWMSAGRYATGERWAFDRYASRLELRREGRRIVYDGLRLSRETDAGLERMGRFNVWLSAILMGPLVSSYAEKIVARVSSQSVAHRSSLIVSAAPLGVDGALLRVAGVSVEQVGAVLERLGFLRALFGGDPLTRQW